MQCPVCLGSGWVEVRCRCLSDGESATERLRGALRDLADYTIDPKAFELSRELSLETLLATAYEALGGPATGKK